MPIADPLLGEAANERNVVKSLPNARIIHLATHAGQGASATQGDTELPSAGLADVALVFSGANLTLTGDQRRSVDPANDGILSGYEIARLPLSGSDLVMLSACDTARGARAGTDGLQSLGYAFHLAGIPNVLMTLWKVDDEKTSQFVTVFYEELLRLDQSDGQRDPEIFRRALRNTQTRVRGPDFRFNYWDYAAFILVEG